MPRSLSLSLLPALSLLLAAACTSTWHDAHFVPSPLEVGVTAEGHPRAEARALIAVRGIRRAVASEQRPAEVELQMRLENVGEVPLALDLAAFDLVTADLISFGAPLIDPPEEGEVAPGAQQLWTLRFPTPEGRGVDSLDWSGLNLRFRVRFGERSVVTGVTFDRLVLPPPGYYYDPFWGPYPYYPYRSHLHVGVVRG